MRRILIVAPLFYPAPFVGAVRVTQFARHLPEFGWQPLVLCRDEGYVATPEALAEHVHPAVRVEFLGPRAAPARPGEARMAREPNSLRKALVGALDAVSVPDVGVWKWSRLFEQAVALAREWRPEVVMSSSPPHSIHVLGRRVAAALGVPWVADFRDPYLIDYRYGPQGARRLSAWRHLQFDRGMYRDAALAVHAIPLHGRWASRRYPFARDKIRILTNGFPSELVDERFLATVERSPRTSIRAAGVLGRGAVALVQNLLTELDKRGIDAEFRHVGKAGDAAGAIPEALRGRIVLRGLVEHKEALREIAGGDILLKYDDQERAKVNGLSSKLFEYLATGRPIVAINPTRPDWQLLRRLPWTRGLEESDPGAIVDAVEAAARGNLKPDAEWLTAFRQRYNRRNQTGQLAEWLGGLVS